MLILSIDCAGHGCGVCVWKDGNVLSTLNETMERGQDQRLMPLIIEALRQANVTFNDLDRIAVTRGPGSFTGLRIGLAAARGLGLATGKPVIGIDRFSIYRAQHPDKDLMVIIASRRKELYCRYYSASEQTEEPKMLAAEEITAFLQDKPKTIVTGDIPADMFPAYQPATEAEHLTSARLAAHTDAKSPEFLPRPLYLRAPDVTMPKQTTKDTQPKMTIRPLPKDQDDLLASLHADCFGSAKWKLKQIQESLALKTTKGWAVFEGDKIIGFALCQLIPDQSEILTICVHPTHRRRGAAEKLLCTAAKAAHGIGSNLFLEVAADNLSALALYEKLGFQRTGHRPHYYWDGEHAVDAILLTLFREAA
jgi:tRNA threonylcarbamoyladenosine biosynthesis protein TsaB